MGAVMLTGTSFVFVHIPRTGGKSITKMLLRHGQETLPGQPGRHTTASEARALLGEQRFAETLSFAVVRNPWDRLLSLYLFHAQTPEQLLASTGQRASPGFLEAHRAFVALGSFEAFLRWVAQGPDGDGPLERHRYTQLAYLTDERGELLVRHILRYERLRSDVKALLTQLGLSAALPWINGHLRPHYTRYYSAQGARLVGGLCAGEIERFDYRYGDEGQ